MNGPRANVRVQTLSYSRNRRAPPPSSFQVQGQEFDCAIIQMGHALSLYRFELGTWAYQNRHVGCHPGIWSKIKFSHKVRYRIKAEVISFLLHYWAGVDSTSPPRSNGGKLSNWRDLLDFG